MSEPMIPKINEHNEVVGETTIIEAVRNKWPRRVVRVFIFDGAGNMLIQKRSETIIGYPGLWDNSVGGHVDVGENEMQAAVRETKEELGITVDLTEVVTAFKHAGTEESLFVSAYVTVLGEQPEIHFDTKDVAAVQWCSLTEFEELITTQPEQFVPAFVDFWHIWRDTLIPS